MNISLSTSQLIITLAVVVVIAVILRLVDLRLKYRGQTVDRPKRTTRTKPSKTRRETPAPHKTHAPVPERGDKGAQVAAKHGKDRSPEWDRVAHEHLAHEPGCRVCGHTGQGLQVHHIKPFHLFPELELDPNNLITLCELKGRDHHLLIGHLDDWESYNLAVRKDVDRYHDENAKKIRANPEWQKESAHRPRPSGGGE
ncbi:MAG TPA: HNH endonuclease signature motif containing protein [Ktedonobacteraceae bacterium]|nr:HNH endonuclease signature motif containing protein [Ktedonobacteraceae bacterium]